jgi:hypothetical protein
MSNDEKKVERSSDRTPTPSSANEISERALRDAARLAQYGTKYIQEAAGDIGGIKPDQTPVSKQPNSKTRDM